MLVVAALSAQLSSHLGDLARGYVKDPAERDTQLALIVLDARGGEEQE